MNRKFTFIVFFILLPFSFSINSQNITGAGFNFSDSYVRSDTQAVYLEKTNLPLIVIDTKGQEILDEPRIIAHMGIIDHGSNGPNYINDEFNVYDGRISIEIRGNSSQQFPKKSYALETQNGTGENFNLPLLGFPEENDWILYAPYTDKSLLRNAITFNLGRKLDTYCSRTLYCELILNDEYQGIYLLMEKIKVDKNRVDIGKLKPDEISGDDLTGGYIFKVDKLDPDYVEGYTGWTSSPEPSYPDSKDIIYQFYDPKDEELVPEQKQYLENAVSKAENALISNRFSDPDSGYNRYLNTGSFIDFMIINEIGKEFDKYRYSNFFYKRKDSKGGEIFAGPIWDFNLAYGNIDYWEGGLETSGWRYDDVVDHEKSIIFLWKRLMEDPYFEDLATTRWQALREDVFSDKRINSIIDSLLNLTADATSRNYERWPILGTYVWPNYNWENNDYDDEVSFFRNWLFDRLHWMDNNFNGRILEPSADLSFSDNSDIPGTLALEVILHDDYFDHPEIDTSDFKTESYDQTLYISQVQYVNASKAVLYLSSTSNILPEDTDVTLVINQEVLNGFESLRTNAIKTGMEEHPDPVSELDIYSAEGILYIRTNTPDKLPQSLEVYNKMGQLVKIYPVEKNIVNTINTSLPSDIYLLRLFVKGTPVIKKLYIE